VGRAGWWHFTKLSLRSQSDYREALERLADLPNNVRDAHTGTRGRVGSLPVASLSPAAVDKLYGMLRAGGVVRQANYPMDVARRA